jgi:hypothetical protein
MRTEWAWASADGHFGEVNAPQVLEEPANGRAHHCVKPFRTITKEGAYPSPSTTSTTSYMSLPFFSIGW